jgi:hypothetical protein
MSVSRVLAGSLLTVWLLLVSSVAGFAQAAPADESSMDPVTCGGIIVARLEAERAKHPTENRQVPIAVPPSCATATFFPPYEAVTTVQGVALIKGGKDIVAYFPRRPPQEEKPDAQPMAAKYARPVVTRFEYHDREIRIVEDGQQRGWIRIEEGE